MVNKGLQFIKIFGNAAKQAEALEPGIVRYQILREVNPGSEEDLIVIEK